MQAKAFLFDLNGTMVNDMDYHTQAWYSLLNDALGAELSWEKVKDEMYGKNREVLLRLFGPQRFSEAEIAQLSAEKERRYQQAFKPHLQLINGLDDFLKKAKAHGKLLAIASAAIADNIHFVIDNLHLQHYFDALVSADDVAESKPHPQTFLKAASLLGVAPQDCVVFEDAPKGVEAAQNAGMKAVVMTTVHGPEAFAPYKNILCFIDDYRSPELHRLFEK